MLSEDHVVFDVYHVHDVLVIMLPQVLEDLEFHTGLVVILLLVLHDLHRDFGLLLVVDASQSRTKRALPKELYDFIPVSNMITNNNLVVAFLVIVAIVVRELVLL